MRRSGSAWATRAWWSSEIPLNGSAARLIMRGGSEKYATTHMSGEAAKFADVNDFADALRSGQASKSNLAWQIVQLREHGIQFERPRRG